MKRNRPLLGMRALRTFFYVAGCVAVATLAGCVIIGDKIDQMRWHLTTVPYFVFDNAPTYHEPPQAPGPVEPVNFCIAISGGGSRSAIFAAGVLEQLAHVPDPRDPSKPLLENCAAISAVSGGSLAAAYYGLYRPDHHGNAEADEEFFHRFKSNMTVDLVNRSVVHYVSHPWEAAMKYYTRYRFVQTLGNTMDQYLFRGATFEALEQREADGRCPAIIINACSLDSGRKFLFTNQKVCNRFNPDGDALASRLGKLGFKGQDAGVLTMLGKIFSTPQFQNFGFDGIDSDIGALRLSTAVSASSAYPALPGPASLIDYATNGYVHLADGGINDNFGVDALIGYYLKSIQDGGKPRRLVVLSINAGSPLKPDKAFNPDGYTSTFDYAERASTVLATRGQTFAVALYNASSAIKVVPLNLTEAPCVEGRLSGKLATYTTTESDMKVVLEAAGQLVQAQLPTLMAAISGKATGLAAKASSAPAASSLSPAGEQAN